MILTPQRAPGVVEEPGVGGEGGLTESDVTGEVWFWCNFGEGLN